MEYKKKAEEIKKINTWFSSLRFFNSSNSKFTGYLQEIEKNPPGTTPENHLLRLLNNYEKESGSKPEIQLYQLFTQSEPLILADFIQNLSKDFSNVSSDILKEHPLFGRIIAWLYYFEPVLIAENIKIPDNFKQALRDYEFERLLGLINQPKEPKKTKAALRTLLDFLKIAPLNNKQHMEMVKVLFLLLENKRIMEYKDSILEALSVLIFLDHSNIENIQRLIENLSSRLKEDAVINPDILEKLGALLGSALNFSADFTKNYSDPTNAIFTFLNLSNHSPAYKWGYILKGLISSLNINYGQGAIIINALEERHLKPACLLNVFQTLGTSSNISHEDIRNIINFLLEQLSNPETTRHKNFKVLSEIIQTYPSVISNDQYEKFINELFNELILRNYSDTIFNILITFSANSKICVRQWEEFFKIFSKKLETTNFECQEIAIHGFNTLAISSMMNQEQRSRVFKYLSSQLNHENPDIQAQVINGFLILIATEKIKDEKNKFLNILLRKLYDDHASIQKYVIDGLGIWVIKEKIKDEQINQFLDILLEKLEHKNTDVQISAVEVLIRFTDIEKISNRYSKITSILLAQKYSYSFSKQDLFVLWWINPNTRAEERQKMIDAWINEFHHFPKKLIISIWKEKTTNPQEREKIINNLLEKPDNQIKVLWLLQGILASESYSKPNLSKAKYHKIIQFALKHSESKNFKLRETAYETLCKHLKFTNTSLFSMCEAAIRLSNQPTTQIAFMSSLKNQAQILDKTRKNTELLEELISPDPVTIVMEYSR